MERTYRNVVFLAIFVAILCWFSAVPSLATSESEELFSPGVKTNITLFGLSLKWEDVPAASFYRVWRMDGGKPVLLRETSAHIWLDADAPSGTGLWYAVTSIDKNGNESPKKWQYTRYLETPAPRATEVMAGFCVEWKAVDGAEKYEIARKNSWGEWEVISTTDLTSYTDAAADPGGSYSYSVTAIWGSYRSVSGKCSSEKLIGIPERLGSVPENFTVSVYGESGTGRELYVYKCGNGENVLLLTFAVHGWEDGFSHDGRAHVFTAYRLMNTLSDYDLGDWTVYIVPCANPDGLIDGSGNYGPGRCTTMMLDGNGNLVSGGVDMNRSFPSYWKRYSYGRNYNGSRPLACTEGEALAKLMEDCMGEGKNVYVDVHGWTEQVIIASWGWSEYWAFASRFPSCDLAYCGTSSGYAASHAAALGYSSGLFEFPYRHASLSSFVKSSLPETFIRAVVDIID